MRSFFGKLATVDEKTLTQKELKIVGYIRENLQFIVDNEMKIERLAQEVGTGYSAIYGLLNKLNINGYRDFAISLANDAESAKIKVAENDENVALDYISYIKQNYSIIEKKNIFESLQLIKSAPRIFITYWENILRGPALEMENFLYDQGTDCYLLDSDWDTITSKVERMNQNDLFIFYTKYGNSKHLEKLTEKIKEKGGKIIFISGRMANPRITQNANSIHTLIIDSTETEKRSGVTVSKSVPFHYFNDLLIYHFMNTDNKKK